MSRTIGQKIKETLDNINFMQSQLRIFQNEDRLMGNNANRARRQRVYIQIQEQRATLAVLRREEALAARIIQRRVRRVRLMRRTRNMQFARLARYFRPPPAGVPDPFNIQGGLGFYKARARWNRGYR